MRGDTAPAPTSGRDDPRPSLPARRNHGGDGRVDARRDVGAAIPTGTVPCFDDDRTQLVADGDRALLCWGERCLADLDDPAVTVARPASYGCAR